MRARAFVPLLLIVLVIATACGSDDDVASDGTQVTPSGIVSVPELLTDDTPRDVVARGVVVWTPDGARLCEVLAESFPPQCGGESVTIADPEMLTVDLQREADVRWTDLPVDLDAHFDGGQLILG